MSNSPLYRWCDEPGTIRIELEREYLSGLMDRAIKKAKSIQKLSELTKLSKATIHNYKNEKHLNIRGIKIILDFLNFKYDRINHKIKKIGWNNDLPKIKLNKIELAIILAASLADGHISKDKFMYKNKNMNLINRIKDCVKTIYGEKIIILDRQARNGVSYILCPSIVKRQLERLGSPKGKKLFCNPRVPEIIRLGSKKQKIHFIRQFFDDEGWAEDRIVKVACSQSADTTQVVPKRFIQEMEFRNNIYLKNIPLEIKAKIIKPNLLIDIKNILEKEFKIYSNLKLKKITKYKTSKGRVYISAGWELNCIRYADVKRFCENIGFFSDQKQKILEEALKKKVAPEDIRLKILNLAIKFHKKQGYFQVKDIKKEIYLNIGQIKKRLSTLVKHKILTNNRGKYIINLEI